eukprot:4876339-Prymnesium_polylepis.1
MVDAAHRMVPVRPQQLARQERRLQHRVLVCGTGEAVGEEACRSGTRGGVDGEALPKVTAHHIAAEQQLAKQLVALSEQLLPTAEEAED